jgi:hypothetical protein
MTTKINFITVRHMDNKDEQSIPTRKQMILNVMFIDMIYTRQFSYNQLLIIYKIHILLGFFFQMKLIYFLF